MPVALVLQALIAIFIVATGTLSAVAQPLRAIPALSARVIDETNTLSGEQRQALETKLAAIEQQQGSQVVVLMVPTTSPEDIAAFANRVGNAWKIGRKDVGDGVLVLVAKDDRRMRIEVAKALEGAIPDIAAARIIDTAMKPRFRDGDFAGAPPYSKLAHVSPAKTCPNRKTPGRLAARTSRAMGHRQIWPSFCFLVSWWSARYCGGYSVSASVAW